MIGAVIVKREFSTSDQIWAGKKERQNGKKYWYDENDAKLRGISSDQGAFDKRLFLRTKHIGSSGNQ